MIFPCVWTEALEILVNMLLKDHLNDYAQAFSLPMVVLFLIQWLNSQD